MSALKLFKSVILGAPASGKGTISSRIIKNFNLVHLSSGDKLRMHIKNQTDFGKQVETYINKGQLVPDELMIELINKEIDLIGDRPWLLDGFPRTVKQADNLWKYHKLDLVINLIVPFDVIIERVKGRWVHLPSGRVYNTDFNAPKVLYKDDVTGEDLVQRDDDQPDVVRKRLEQYDELTRPVIEYYRQKKVLCDFTGSTSDEIWPKVLNCLTTYIPLNITAENAAVTQ